MPFVQRRNQEIVGLFANLQPDIAEEWLEEDAPEVLIFRDRWPRQRNWGEFRIRMMAHPAYRRVASAANLSNPLEVQQLQIAISMPEPYLPIIQQLWGVLLNATEQPTSEEIAEWNEIASRAQMPFRFDAQGLMFNL
jgi:hypothetical protein